jgi:hypothetical protein
MIVKMMCGIYDMLHCYEAKESQGSRNREIAYISCGNHENMIVANEIQLNSLF